MGARAKRGSQVTDAAPPRLTSPAAAHHAVEHALVDALLLGRADMGAAVGRGDVLNGVLRDRRPLALDQHLVTVAIMREVVGLQSARLQQDVFLSLRMSLE